MDQKKIEQMLSNTKRDYKGCLVWQKSVKNRCGYAHASYKGKNITGHRLMWQLVNGKIPEDKMVLHHCGNGRCINIHHLYLGTPKDNMRDRTRHGANPFANRSHCPRGHEYTPENTRTARYCKTCEALRSRRLREKKFHAIKPYRGKGCETLQGRNE